MRIFEEYLNRHRINVPVAHHFGSGSLILRTFDSSIWKNRWILINIRWEDHDHHPGKYFIEMNSPVHDGYLSETVFSKWSSVMKKWHEYEDFLLDWVDGVNGVRPVLEEKEVTLAAWEMFVFAYDSWFMKQSGDVKRILFESLDSDRPTNYRYQHFQDVAIFLATHHPAVLRVWKYEVLFRVNNYADWLGNLLKNKSYASLERKEI